MPDFEVSGEVLAWARTLRGISRSDAARRLGLSESDLQTIEKTDRPKVKQATLRKMSTEYQVPYGTLFMPNPLPHEEPTQYRTFRGRTPKLSEATLAAWSDVNEAVDSFAELLDFDPALIGHHDLPRITRRDDVEQVAAIERARLKVTLAQQHIWSEAQARDGWRNALEALGIYVYFIKMPREDCMGFSILDDRAIPAICVNDDSKLLERQKTFTLIHEYCHLLLRKPGISDQGNGNVVEHFCNQFAAAVLVPKSALRAILPGGGPRQEWSTADIRKTANRFNVSMEVIALRIEELGMARPGFHARKVREWTTLGLLQKVRSRSIPHTTWAERMARRFGRKHTNTVSDAFERGAFRYAEARDLIGIEPQYFPDVKAALR
jgi:Zn-dependent peptidase ImmA (M78 family)/transcriptional regulator with XRE-family HTH domain